MYFILKKEEDRHERRSSVWIAALTRCRRLCGLNVGYVNHVARFVEGSRNRHLFALVLLCILLIIEEVSAWFAVRCLACEQGILSGCELYDLAGECLICLLGLVLLGLWRLSLLLLGTVGLSSQAGGGNAEGRRQNQRERLSRMVDYPFHIFVHYFSGFICNVDVTIAFSAKVKTLEITSPS